MSGETPERVSVSVGGGGGNSVANVVMHGGGQS